MVKIRLAKLIKSIKSAAGRKNLSFFLLCLLISFLFWLFIKLSRENLMEYTYEVNVENVSSHYYLAPLSDNTIDVKYLATGAKFLSSGFYVKSSGIKVDFKQLKSKDTDTSDMQRFFITSGDLKQILSEGLDLNVEIYSISPDTLFFIGNKIVKKKCPVLFNSKLNYSSGYKLYGDIEIEPDSVVVTLPEHEANKVDYVICDYEHVAPVESSITFSAPLKLEPDIEYYEIKPDSVNVYVPVEKYTELEFEIPVYVFCDNKILKPQEFPQLRLLPGNVKVNNLVALKDFSDIEEEDFIVGIDCNDFLVEPKQSRLKIRVYKFPDNVIINHVEPEKVDYILLK